MEQVPSIREKEKLMAKGGDRRGNGERGASRRASREAKVRAPSFRQARGPRWSPHFGHDFGGVRIHNDQRARAQP